MKKILNIKETIESLQNIDPLADAEKIVGESYKTNEEAGILGMFLQMEKSKKIDELMDITDDTKFRETTSEYLRKVMLFGFEIVYKEDFISDNTPEEFYILWHKEYSILLSFDTFNGFRNSGNFYYNWSGKNKVDAGSLLSTGHYYSLYMNLDDMKEYPNPEKEPRWVKETWEEFHEKQKAWSERNSEYVNKNNLRRVWVGSHDCREAIKNNINNLAENGDFIKKWFETPFMWLCHHGDKESGKSYKSHCKERFEKLPSFVKDCIPFKE